MPTPTYTPLANITLGTSAASVTFSSISQAYRDLVLVANWQVSSGFGTYSGIRFNSDTGANYNIVHAVGTGSAAASGSSAGETKMYLGSFYSAPTADVQLQSSISVMDYSATDKHKSALQRFDNSSALVVMDAQRWASTSAITSLQVFCVSAGQAFKAGSTFALYGINA